MREWARSDESVAASVRSVDRRLLRAVRQAFLDYGFDQEEADVRATATFAAGVGFLHLSDAVPDERDTARAERFLARWPGSARLPYLVPQGGVRVTDIYAALALGAAPPTGDYRAERLALLAAMCPR
jgi:hypothetical protein